MATRVSERARPPTRRAVRRRQTPSFDLAESKLRIPVARPGIVDRDALVARLVGAPAVISVVAPPGYGKTTLLAQWARLQPRLAWISVDHRDNDPTVLLTYIAVAVERVEPLDSKVFREITSRGGTVGTSRLLAAIGAMDQPLALVLDHAEALTNPECLDIVAELALQLPIGSQMAIASRDNLQVPVAHLSGQGRLVEIASGDLAMHQHEARALLQGAGVELVEDDLRDLLGRTEGWPVGLYLAALAVRAGGPETDAGITFSGDDRYMSDYLRSELLDRVSPSDVSFLTRTSILERMCGPLCDAVLQMTGSAAILERLERNNLLVVPLDRSDEWYRYHHLFRQLLNAELRHREPEGSASLHGRAATWFAANGRAEQAIDHAQAAGDADQVARLVLNVMQPVWASGRVDTVLRWMTWLEDKTWVEHYAAIAVHGALILALLGRADESERWAGAAAAAPPGGTLPDGNTMDGSLAYLRALRCCDGVEAMRRDARLALDGLDATSPYRATMLHTEGVAHLLEGDHDRADVVLAQAADVASGAGALPLVALVLAERGMIAADRAHWLEADALAGRALDIVGDGDFEDYWTSALVYAVAARVAVERRDLARAGELTASAARLRPLLTYALPVVSAQALLELARAYVALGDRSGARVVLRQIADIHHQRPDLGLLPQQASALRATLDTVAAAPSGASSLTAAELRLLPLLPTHLTLRQISERLYLSPNTVKSQAIAVYRKFGVSSRSEAVAHMHEVGLIAGGGLAR